MNDEENYEINNPQSERTLEKLNCRKIYLFRPNQLNIEKQKLRDIIFLNSELSFTCSLFLKIYQFYQSLQANDFLKQYQQEINEKMQINATQSCTYEYLFFYFMMNIEIEFQKNLKSKYTQKFNLNTRMYFQEQFIDLSEFEYEQFYRSISQMYFEELIRNKEFPVLIELLEYFVKVLNQSKPNKAIEQYYFESNQPKKVIKQRNQLFLQQNNNMYNFLLFKNFHNLKQINQFTTFFNEGGIFFEAQIYGLSSIGYLDMNYDHYGETKIYSKNNLNFVGYMNQGLFEGYGKIYNKGIVKYEGMFSYNQKHGQGILFSNGLIYSGKFLSDDLFGEVVIQNQFGYQEKKYYLKGQDVTKEYFDQLGKTFSSQIPYFYYSFYCDYAINVQSYKALEPGRWLFEGTVDYFIEYFKNYFEYSRGKLNTIIFNTNDTSNYISNDEKNLFIIKQQLSDDIQAQRKVFILNSQRSHFMIMIEDEGQLYCCDSLYVKNQNRDEEFSKLLGLKKKQSIKLNCTQQMNGHDCGIFAIYYAIKFMKYDKCSIKEIESKLEAKNIGQFRWQLKQLIKNNHNYILTNI